jgi:hypothetical protein
LYAANRHYDKRQSQFLLYKDSAKKTPCMVQEIFKMLTDLAIEQRPRGA